MHLCSDFQPARRLHEGALSGIFEMPPASFESQKSHLGIRTIDVRSGDEMTVFRLFLFRNKPSACLTMRIVKSKNDN